MFKNLSLHYRAILQALFVTFLWSTSWVLIKIGLKDIPPLLFAGLRYMLAFICLLPFAIHLGKLKSLRFLHLRTWLQLILLGLLLYSVTQGTVFLSLFYLSAMTSSLIFSFTTIAVALLGILLLGEKPTIMHWGGTGLYFLGILIYFYPLFLPANQLTGLIIGVVCVLANSLSTIPGSAC
jgi:drug/metabolite transporter (DMT)-like permease